MDIPLERWYNETLYNCSSSQARAELVETLKSARCYSRVVAVVGKGSK